MARFYSSGLSRIAQKIRDNKAHILLFGDSQQYESRSWTLSQMLQQRLSNYWHYCIAPGGAANQAANPFAASAYSGAAIAATSHGVVFTDVNHGAGTPNLGRGSRVYSPTPLATNIADATVFTTGGIVINRIHSGTNTIKSSSVYPWPLIPTNSFAPWYFTNHMKAAPVIQGFAGNTWAQFRHRLDRLTPGYGSGASTTGTESDVTIADTATIQRGDWTPPTADSGGYQTTAGTAGALIINNDHYPKYIWGTKAGYDESSRYLALDAVIFARCDASGVIAWNPDGSGGAYDCFGRSGSAVEDWRYNYWTLAQWTEYFGATVLAPTPQTVVVIQLGHNVRAAEITSNLVNSTWIANYQELISRLKSAYASACPTGTLDIMLVTPWTHSGGFINSTARGDSMQAAIEGLCAANSRTEWFSYYNYFNKVQPIKNLHPETEYDGILLADAFLDGLSSSLAGSGAGSRTTMGIGF